MLCTVFCNNLYNFNQKKIECAIFEIQNQKIFLWNIIIYEDATKLSAFDRMKVYLFSDVVGTVPMSWPAYGKSASYGYGLRQNYNLDVMP